MNSATPSAGRQSLNRLALSATIHCLTGCSIGEVLGMVIGSVLDWENWPTVALSTVLAFVFGYLLTLLPLLKAGTGFRSAIAIALASDTVSITIMEIVDNAVMLVIPGAMESGPTDPFFWLSLAGSLVVAGSAAYPANLWLIGRQRGSGMAHGHH